MPTQLPQKGEISSFVRVMVEGIPVRKHELNRTLFMTPLLDAIMKLVS